MKRANNLFDKIIEPDNLRLAFWKASKGKRHSKEVLRYAENLDKNISQLRDELIAGKVSVGKYRYFKIYEPKVRQICASAFSEQVLHHAMMNICHPFFEKAQIFDSYASRKTKGTYAAIARAKDYTLKKGYYLKLDIKKFFETIQHDILKQQLRFLFKEQQLLAIFDQIIDSYEAHPKRGVPIGNLTSQYFANHFLSGLDHFIKEKLAIKAYVRYMDDMILWHNDKKVLKNTLIEIELFIDAKLQCSLKPIQLNRTETGLPFLGYHIFPHYMHLLQKSKTRFIRKINKIDKYYHTQFWNETACQRKILPLLAFISHAECKIFKKNVILRLKGIAS